MDSAKILVLLVGFTIVLVTISIFIYLPSTSPYSPYNPGPDGLSTLKNLINPSLIYRGGSLSGYDVVVLVLEGEPRDLGRYFDFVVGGGTLVILDDEGYSNELLSLFGGSMRIVNSSVLDEVFKFGDRLHPKINMSMEGLYATYLPGYIEATSRADVLGYSSVFSYLDVDGDGNYTVGEPIGAYPLVVSIGYGEGRVLVVSDKDFLDNVFLDKGVNTGFIDEFLVGRVAIDLSTTHYSSVDLVKYGFEEVGGVGGSLLYSAIFILLTLVGVVIYGELEEA